MSKMTKQHRRRQRKKSLASWTRRTRQLEQLEPRYVLDSTVVFNEIMFHPAENDALEFVELHNQMAVDMDISMWELSGGVNYEFPEGTVVAGGGYVVVAADPDALASESGVVALGPYLGQLANDGENLELRDRSDRLMNEVDYGDGGVWPVSPDGTGASLAKFNQDANSELAENWTSMQTRHRPCLQPPALPATRQPLLKIWFSPSIIRSFRSPRVPAMPLLVLAAGNSAY
jgi:hypothetical protein